ncbi:MAG: serine endopeptidase [Proteobacteria bacterium]|nr:serine endopeptidase [Pseudomonadota bacterium]
MSKALRLSEKWFQRGLWLVALVFAGFLIGLGGTLVGDLPKVEAVRTLDDFMDRAATDQARAQQKDAQRAAQEAQDRLEQARLQLQVAQSDVANVRQGFGNWIATRRATERPEQDPELIERTRALDTLQARERQARASVEAEQQKLLDAQQTQAQSQRRLGELQEAAQGAYTQALRAQELRVFGYRLALTLPLLAVAGWLFARQRHSRWWPFVWGFILFAVFAFFVELVPYLPSYGGYVRYVVGIVLTVLVGRWAIVALQRYLERQRDAEARPEQQRREAVGYDTALARMGKGVCPGCERAVDMKNTETDFCPHCGLGLFNRCGHCGTRKNAFSRFCQACGTTAEQGQGLPLGQVAPGLGSGQPMADPAS